MTATIVTGAAGFIGSSLCDRLLATGQRVVGVDSFDPFYDRRTKERNLVEARSSSRFCFVEADVRDASLAERIRAVAPEVSMVVHLAAKAGVRPSIECPRAYVETNTGGTAACLDLARALGVEHFVFGSSSSVYGNDTPAPFAEDAVALSPISPYAASKRAAEILCANWATVYGLRCVSLRFFTVVGERQRPDLALHAFTRAILRGERIRVFGDGSMRRDFTYIQDIVDGIVASLAYVQTLPAGAHDVINLGGHASVTVLELIRTIERASGCRAQVEFAPHPQGDVNQTCADIGKARRALGFAPRVQLDEAVERFVGWFRATMQEAV
jgi:UDP-glucuronate 4-epimerase